MAKDVKEKLVVILKWLAFVFCSIGFTWKTADSFWTYCSSEVGTKIELKENYQVKLPSLAVCR